MLIEPCNLMDQKARIFVIGVGGGGGNALNRMIEEGMTNVDFVAINTDAQDLEYNNSQTKLQIGKELTQGLGAGANSDIGREAVVENKEVIIKTLSNVNMVFITAGMGGGTGTGAAPAIAAISKELGILTVGVVTQPFKFEGPMRKRRAEDGIKELKKNCDTLIVIPNETILEITDVKTTVKQSFKIADEVLLQATKGISDLINVPGEINLDFADVSRVMLDGGDAIMGTGLARGEERAILAAQEAINSPLLQDANIKGARGLLVNISGPADMTIHELNDASSIIYEEAGENANVILGCVVDNSLTNQIHITVIATGLNDDEYPKYFGAESMKNVPTTDNPIENNGTIKNESNDGISKENSDDIMSFGDELEVPTFLRNKNS